MAEILKKITGLFSDSKTRIIALISVLLIIIGIVWGIIAIFEKMNGPLGPETSVSVSRGPNIESVPGDWERKSSPEYIRQVKQRNVQEAKKAEQQGTSAIPTITESSALTEDLDPSKISGGASFSTLKKLESVNPDELKSIALRCKAVGALVFDKQGNTAGTVGPNGVVKDPCGRTIGTVGDDCNVRDANGKIIGKAGNTTLGNAIYDPQGRLIGTVGPDGQVRDLAGNIIGKIDENGVVRDLNGQIIPTGNAGANDRLVYDENGNVIGIAGPDGTIRDASGKIIGTLGPDGIAKGLNGEIIGKAGNALAKALVYDKNGKLIGVVGPDGKVRDASGKVIGVVGPDGVVRDLKGKIIGSASSNVAGAPVYDSSGRLIGTVGPDGIVRDAQGNVIGTVGSDGVVRNAKGEIVGKAGSSATGIPVYDENGNLIGMAGPDGIVRDAKGNIIGKVDPKTGQVLNSQGKVIGKIAANALAKVAATGTGGAAGTPVYDNNGKLIGTVGPDGIVRDAQGNIIGTVGPDGIVRNAQGKIIGKIAAKGALTTTIPPGTPVYDKNGKLIGTVGPDGIVRDAQGNIIGTVGPDGIVRNAQGEIIGKAGTVPEGTPIYDENGNIIGTVGPDGIVRDAKGNVIGMYDPATGTVVDKQGRILGQAAAKAIQKQDPLAALGAAANNIGKVPGATANNTEAQLLAAKQKQEELFSQQQTEAYKQQIQGLMTGQASQLFTAWAPPTQQYVTGNQSAERDATGYKPWRIGTNGQDRTRAASTGMPGQEQPGALIKAGTVMFGVLTTAVNTDQPGPIMATIVSGPLKGAKLLGTVQRQGEKALLSFNIMNSEKFARTVGINAVAIDPETARTAVATDVDNHYLLRYGSLFASSFIQGYATALTTAGSTVTSLGLGLSVVKQNPDLSGKGKVLVALGNVGAQYSTLIGPIFNTPPTVTVASGTGVGLLFLSDIAGAQ